MKKAPKFLLMACLALGLVPTVQAQNTVTLNGSIVDIFNNADTSEQICATLKDTKPDHSGGYQTPVNPHLAGSGITVNVNTVCKDATGGTYNFSLLANDKILTQSGGSATVWAITAKGKRGGESTIGTFRFLAGQTYDLSVATPITTVPVATPPTGDTTYARLDGGNQPFIRNITITPNVNNIDVFSITRQTDSAPTGNFINLKSLAGATLFKVDIAGNSTAASYTTAGVLSATGGGTLGGTFGGNPILSGNPAFTGSPTAGKFNNTLILDGSKYTRDNAGIHLAATDSNTSLGTIIKNPDGVSTTLTATLTVGQETGPGTSNTASELEIGKGAGLAVNITNGTDAIVLSDGASVVGHGSLPNGNSGYANATSDISLASGANIGSLFTPINTAGGQEGIQISNLFIHGPANCSATIGNSIFNVQGMFTNTHLTNLYTASIPGKILRIRPGSSTLKIASDLMFLNDNFDATGCAGGLPVSVENAAASGIFNILKLGGGSQHAGASNPLEQYDGAGVAAGISTVTEINNHLENVGTAGTSAVTLRDIAHFFSVNSLISGTSNTDVYNISQSGASRTHDIEIDHFTVNGGTPTNLVNNTISGFTIPRATFGNDLMSYKYNGTEFRDSVNTVVQSKAYVAAGDITAGGIHLVPQNLANGQMAAITFGGANNGTIAGGSANAAEAGIYAECSSVFGCRLHLASTNTFAGAIRGLTLDENGNLKLVRSSTNFQDFTGLNMARVVGSGTGTTAGTAVAAGTSQSISITVTGATTTDVAQCSTNAAYPATWLTGITVLPPAIASANTITLTIVNPTAGSITPAAQTFRCTVTR